MKIKRHYLAIDILFKKLKFRTPCFILLILILKPIKSHYQFEIPLTSKKVKKCEEYLEKKTLQGL